MGHKILLADDSITIQKVIELTFSDEDFELHTVGNGQKAVDEIRAIMPDIVLCDIIMPEKNGYEVCEFIKSANDLKHIPVLLLTGAFEPFDQERAKAAGCEGFLAKPFEPQTLISKVKELLESAASSPAAGAIPAEIGRVDEMLLGATASNPVRPEAVPAPDTEGLNEAFAIEAGERELSMDPGDHTVLLGSEGRGASASSAPPPTSGEDIWGQIGADVSEPEPAEDDASTVFMAPPPALATTDVQEDEDTAATFGSPDPDTTWQMPGTELSADDSSADDVASRGDFGGFEDFADVTESASQVTSPIKSMPPPQPPPPPAAAAPPPPPPPEETPMESFEATESGPYTDFDPVSDFEPIQDLEPLPPAQPKLPTRDAQPESFDGSVTVDTTGSANVAYEVTASSADADPFAEPEPSESFVEPEPEIVAEEAASEPFPGNPSHPEPVDAAPSPRSLAAEPSNAASPAGGASIDDALIDKIAQRVVDKLSSKVLQEIAWEVVPDLAEGLIQKEIDALKAKIPK